MNAGLFLFQESMLNALQSSVETAETDWKARLSAKENELDQIRVERDQMSEKNSALSESLKVLQNAEEVNTNS